MDLPKNNAVAITQKITAALFSIFEKIVASLAESWQTWLALPIIKQIFEHEINKFGGMLSAEIQKDEALLIIDFQDAEKKKSFIDAVNALMAIAPGGQTDEALKKARDAVSHAINWSGSP